MKKSLLFIAISLLFISCSKSLTDEERTLFIERGNEIAHATAIKLGGTLTEKMKTGGIIEAAPFCNVMAIPLTKEMSNKYNATIKRTSHKIRSEKNTPTIEESRVLNEYLKLFGTNKEIGPKVELDKLGKPHYYAPILLQKKCLVCHGKIGSAVSVKTDSIIKSYYPDDLATGFKEGDLRGIWSITFETN